MMGSINMKSVLTLMFISILVGCKTVSGGMDIEEESENLETVVIDEVVEEKVSVEDRKIEEVTEVLDIIEESKIEESDNAMDANSTVQNSGEEQAEPKVISLDDVTAVEICSAWKSNRSRANSAYLGKEIPFNGKMTSLSHNAEYSDNGNMVFIDADQSVSLGVMFSSIRETLHFRTGQYISFKGELTEIKKVRGGRCLFVVKNASLVR